MDRDRDLVSCRSRPIDWFKVQRVASSLLLNTEP
jgi:hypothetical protein